MIMTRFNSVADYYCRKDSRENHTLQSSVLELERAETILGFILIRTQSDARGFLD